MVTLLCKVCDRPSTECVDGIAYCHACACWARALLERIEDKDPGDYIDIDTAAFIERVSALW